MTYAYNEQAAGGDVSQIWANQVCQQLRRVDDVGLFPITFSYPIPSDIDSATALYLYFHTEQAITLYKAYVTYTEASLGGATACEIKIGKESDDDYYYTGTAENSKAQWYNADLTLLQTDLAAGDTLIIYCANDAAGGQTGKLIFTILAQYLKSADGT